MKNTRLIYIWMLLILAAPMISCNPESEDVDPGKVENVVQQAIFESMKEFYYWEDKLPETFNSANFSSNEEVLEALRFKELDRWSYLTTREAFNAAFTGQATGAHGVGLGIDQDENWFVTFVYRDGPAGKDGWQRGWQFLEINGKAISEYKTANGGFNFQLGPNEKGISNTFKFRLPDGTETTRTILKDAFQTNSVLHQTVYDLGSKKVGHWVYQSFRATQGLTPTRSREVEDSFNYFMAENIDELVIDLRYNGGGSVAVTAQILNYIAPSAADGKVMYMDKHNSKKSNFNKTVNFSKTGNLNLNRLIVITSRGSASASELLINCLTPYMEVVLIGDDTYGKPVGSFPLSSFNRTLSANNVELVPITFATANAQNRADFFDGFPANFKVGDDLTRNWDNREEKRIKAALDFINNGTISGRIMHDYYKPKWEMIDAFEGLQKEFPMY
ncbi:S41 family peptidase [Aquiflexum sp.]|uniref:S41 family peptidase n=1 Tax=Aquiflexum sp. TaxID=1872584 RepID=UPI003594452D